MSHRSGFRPEIQGLRAVAVLLVLLYHVWPSVLSGGYIGVDVFFVISGFLITDLLLREVDATGRISFGRFYARRARRLLPAAVVTLGATMAATVLLLPPTQWRDIAHEVVAAAAYFENWWLAIEAVDYLAIDSAASPIQHFWSLSVEEQYYLVWPLLLAGCAWLVRLEGAPGRFRRVSGALLAAVFVTSLAYSVVSGLTGSTAAYFSTFTRIWQLAAGGLLAVAGCSEQRAQPVVLSAGLLGIFGSALVLSDATAYPGHAALWPTVGAVLALQAGAAYARWPLTSWLGWGPVQYIGDISYSLYLWHWPLVVLAKHFTGETLGAWGIAVLAVSLGMAGVSKRFVEDVFRHAPTGAARSTWRVLLPAGGASIACVVAALLLARGSGNLNVDVASAGGHPGAAAMLQPGPLPPTPRSGFLPSAVNAVDDVSTAYTQHCIQDIKGTDVRTCVYGKDTAPVRVAVVGDSHAVHWFPAFAEIARLADVQVVGIAKTSCLATEQPIYHRKLNRAYDECAQWTRNVIGFLKRQRFDYVVLSESQNHRVYGMQDQGPEASVGPLAKGMRVTWSALDGTGTKVVVLRSTPWQPTLVPECVASHPETPDKCTGPPSSVLFDDVMTKFAQIGHYPLLDFSDLFCRDGRCPAVIGNVFVYRDAHHITATYMRTVAPMLAERLGLRDAKRVALGTQTRPVSGALSRIQPALASAATDRGEAFAGHCVQSTPRNDVISCHFGAVDGRRRIAIVGDSMGANLVPGFIPAAKSASWAIDTFFKDSCLFSAAPVYHRRLKREFRECSRWGERVLKQLDATPPDLVVLVQSSRYADAHAHSYEQATPVLTRGISEYIDRLQHAGTRVAVVRYMPLMPFDVPQCLLREGDVDACSAPRATALPDGPLLRIARQNTRVALLDLADAFCGKDTCPPVVNGLLVYRDAMQPTASFARTLDNSLYEQLAHALSQAKPVAQAAHPTAQ